MSSYSNSGSSDEEVSPEEMANAHEVKVEEFVSDKLGDDPNMPDSEWNRLYRQGLDYYKNHELPIEDEDND